MTRLWPLLIYHDLHPRRTRRARVAALHKIQIPEDATQPELLAVAQGTMQHRQVKTTQVETQDT